MVDIMRWIILLQSPNPDPAGRIVMGTLVAQIRKIGAAYSPSPPEGFVSLMTWGIEKNELERFASAGVPKEDISFVRDTYTENHRSS